MSYSITYNNLAPQQTINAMPSNDNVMSKDVMDWAMAIALDEYRRLDLLRTLNSTSRSNALTTTMPVVTAVTTSSRPAPESSYRASTNTNASQFIGNGSCNTHISSPVNNRSTATTMNNSNNLYVINPANISVASNSMTFPYKLHTILSNAQHADIIHWTPHGKCFRIMKPKALEKILPLYFRHGKYSSFQRQLYIWGFQRVRSGVDRNAYFHECFRRGELQMCAKMDRKKESSSKPISRSGSPSVPSSPTSSKSSGSVTPDVDGPASPQRSAAL